MGKRHLWKTICFTAHKDYYNMQAAWGSSSGAFGKNKVMNFGGSGNCSIETNISLRGLRDLARHAGVKIDWNNGILWDEMTAEERYKQYEAEITTEAEQLEMKRIHQRYLKNKASLSGGQND